MAAGDDPNSIFSLVETPPGTALHWLALGGGRPSAGTAHSGEDLARLLGSARSTWNLYLGVHPCGASLRRRPSSSEIYSASTLFLDFDPITPDARPLEAAEEGLAHASDLLRTRLYPHLIDSGRGAQLWIPLVPTPFRDHADRTRWQLGTSLFLRALAARLQGAFGTRLDTATADLARVGRLPGSINHKTGRPAILLHRSTRRHDLTNHILSYGSNLEDSAQHLTTCSTWQNALPLLNVTSRRFITEGTTEPGRHAAAYAAAISLCELGISIDGALHACAFGAWLCEPRLKYNEVHRCVMNAYQKKGAMDGHLVGLRRI